MIAFCVGVLVGATTILVVWIVATRRHRLSAAERARVQERLRRELD